GLRLPLQRRGPIGVRLEPIVIAHNPVPQGAVVSWRKSRRRSRGLSHLPHTWPRVYRVRRNASSPPTTPPTGAPIIKPRSPPSSHPHGVIQLSIAAPAIPPTAKPPSAPSAMIDAFVAALDCRGRFSEGD